MELIFFNAEYGSLGDKLFAWLTNGPYSQVQIRFSDGRRWGVNFQEGCIGFDPLPFEDASQWDAFKLYDGDEEKALKWAENHSGRFLKKRKFFFLSIFLRVLRFGYDPISKALEKAGFTGLPEDSDANEMWRWVQEWITNHPYDGPKIARVSEIVSWE